MSHKFENWKFSVEIDYLSMYIKTWFAFLATAKELYPESISMQGDGSLINKYKEELTVPLNYEESINPYIENVFRVGVEIIKRDFPESFFGYFYLLNKKFEIVAGFEKSGLKTEVIIAFKEKLNGKSHNNLFIIIKSDNPKFKEKLNCHHIETNISIDDLMKDENYQDRDKVINIIYDKILEAGYRKITTNDITDKEELKGFVNGHALPIMNDLRGKFKLESLFQPLPTKGFPDDYDISKNKIKTLQWFIQFNYSLRNILFHHVIDPFDSKWLLLFKNAYLALQEITDYNIILLNKKNETV